MKSLIRVALAATLGIVIAACGSTSAAAPPSGASPTPGARGAGRNGASGELVQLSGSSLILSTQAGDVTVTFAATTTIQKTSTAGVADITVGSCIIASGQKDATGQLVATTVRLSPAVNGACSFGNFGGGGGQRPTPSGTPSGTPRPGQANLALARGQVAGVNGTAVTVKDSTGASQTISVPTTVKVARSATGTSADLVVGACVMANGTKDSSGNVTARTLSIVPAGPSGCFTGGRGGGGFGGGGGGLGGGGGGGLPGGGPPPGG
jgi:hypothetical protein